MNDQQHEPVLDVHGLTQELYDPDRGDRFTVSVDKRVTLYPGDFAALLGPSGCGKTTLLSVLGLLRKPTKLDLIENFSIGVIENGTGVVERSIDIKSTWTSRDTKIIEELRRAHVGFALQSGELLASLTVAENIAMPLHLNHYETEDISARVDELIDAFGLSRNRENDGGENGKISLANSRVNKLSGGEYQRVVLARAIAHNPDLIFVDEPTAALNHQLARQSLQRLRELQNKEKCAILMITHDEHLAKEFANVLIQMEPVEGKPAGHIASIRRVN